MSCRRAASLMCKFVGSLKNDFDFAEKILNRRFLIEFTHFHLILPDLSDHPQETVNGVEKFKFYDTSQIYGPLKRSK